LKQHLILSGYGHVRFLAGTHQQEEKPHLMGVAFMQYVENVELKLNKTVMVIGFE